MPEKYTWSRLNSRQVGRYAEYYAMMEFTLYGFDVYTAEVDDKGIDFIVRRDQDTYFDVQVKSVRSLNYIFLRKKHFQPRPALLLTVALLQPGIAPILLLIPSTVWNQPDGVFVSRDYESGKSKPEWGINVSKKNLPRLRHFDFDQQVSKL